MKIEAHLVHLALLLLKLFPPSFKTFGAIEGLLRFAPQPVQIFLIRKVVLYSLVKPISRSL